jgi:hypothetical protein
MGPTEAKRTRSTRWVPIVGVAALLSAACGSSAPNVSVTTLLQKAKVKADSAAGIHFVLSSKGVGTSGTNLVGGTGDLIRPAQLQGTFSVTVSGFVANVKVVSVGNVFEAETPFSTHYVKTSPSSYGLTNPTQLLDTNNGLTSLLALAQNPQKTGSERINGELLDTVAFTVPGSDIPVLPDADPSKPVNLIVAIDPRSFEMRQITLTGPLVSATSDCSYTLLLSDYNEHVNITLPPTS